MADDSWKDALGEEARADLDAAVKVEAEKLQAKGVEPAAPNQEVQDKGQSLDNRGATVEQIESSGQALNEQGVEFKGEVSQEKIDDDFSYNPNNHPSEVEQNQESYLSQWETENPEQEQSNNAKETELDNREAELDDREITQDDEGR